MAGTFMHVAPNYHAECAVKLLAEKENGMKDKNGDTALTLARKYGHPNCVELLNKEEQDIAEYTAQVAISPNMHTDSS